MKLHNPNLLDPSYGQGGLANLHANVSWVNAVVTVSGGAFACGVSDVNDYTCFRLNEQGELDTSWAFEGRYSGQFKPGDRAEGRGLLPLADGKLLMFSLHTEQTGNQRKKVPALVRFGANGLPDNTFGDRGHKILYELNAGEAADADTGGAQVGLMACHSRETGDGRIYLNVTYPAAVGLVARLNADGTLDTRFNGTGVKYMTSPNGTQIRANALYHDASSDRLLICGELLDGVGRPCVIRLTADGREDSSFGDGGYAVIGDIQGRFNGLILRNDHDILCVGSEGYSQHQALVHGLDGTGAALPGFFPSSMDFAGVGGTWSHIAIDPASNALVTLGLYHTPDSDVVVGRYLADGRIDTGFAEGLGWANITLANGAEIQRDLALEDNGNALVCGFDLGSGDTASRGFVLRCLTGTA
ncbi:hypothetical protein ACX3YG_02720 [Pseudomonas wadenswilerensis]